MLNDDAPALTSLSNPRVKHVVKLRRRSHRDEDGLMLIEGYRELRRAVDNAVALSEVFFCPELYQGSNEPTLLAEAANAGATLTQCNADVFRKMAYRDRPEGLLAVAPQIHRGLDTLTAKPDAFYIVAEAIEKPGNLGTILRSADATGVDALIVCDRCTDIHNPNVVRASIGTMFCVPVIEASTDEAIAWLRQNQITMVAATPHTDALYTDTDLTGPVAIVVGTEKVGLSDAWLEASACPVRIPMLGQCDSLNVASATSLLLYEVVRQRMSGSSSSRS